MRSESIVLTIVVAVFCIGCGTTKMKTGTEQLLMSDAVDRSIAALDFRPLGGKKVYLDSDFIRPVKGIGFVNSDYIISSLRQQIASSGCMIQDDRNAADIIIEARVGVLGADGYAVTYGLPASNMLSTAATLFPETPPVPTIPELSIGRREAEKALAKIAAFAYDRETRQPVWQSGLSQSESDAKDTWVLGIGPFESGTVRDKTQLAGKSFRFDRQTGSAENEDGQPRPRVEYSAEMHFDEGFPLVEQRGTIEQGTALDAAIESRLQQVSYEQIEAQVAVESSGPEPDDEKPADSESAEPETEPKE